MPGLQQQQLDGAAGGAARLKPGPQHPGVVDHQQIAGLKLMLQVPDAQVTGMGRWANASRVNRQQPRAVAWLHRPLGDALWRQREVVTGEEGVSRIQHSAA